MQPVRKNQIIKLDIYDISHEGDGVGRFEGFAVFVPMSAIGDKLEVKIVKVLKNHAYAIIERLLEPSPDRMEPLCPVYNRCGGCSLRHISYEAEARIKHKLVTDNLARIGGVSPRFEPILPSPVCERYRNKAQYPIRQINGKACAGFFAKRSHALIPVDDCLLQPAFFAKITRTLLEFMDKHSIPAYDEIKHEGIVRHLYIRHAGATNQTMVCVVVNSPRLPYGDELCSALEAVCPGSLTLLLNHNTRRTNVITGNTQTVLSGGGIITDTLRGIHVDISAGSFYQVNHAAAELLYEQALVFADPKPSDTLLDLYCGTGTIGLSMAHTVKELIGVEVVPQAIADANENARKNNITNARFICADAGEAAARLAGEGLSPDIVLLDPPRKGADENTLSAVCAMNPGKIVYISCNSATLARDAKWLGERGYRMEKARAVDLFPRTAHVECVALMVRPVGQPK